MCFGSLAKLASVAQLVQLGSQFTGRPRLLFDSRNSHSVYSFNRTVSPSSRAFRSRSCLGFKLASARRRQDLDSLCLPSPPQPRRLSSRIGKTSTVSLTRTPIAEGFLEKFLPFLMNSTMILLSVSLSTLSFTPNRSCTNTSESAENSSSVFADMRQLDALYELFELCFCFLPSLQRMSAR
ncbi:uncharacterized protein HMPREF1120_00564 [Exophiala dermatitidis NIH/UT8656]|uniref:Uncharacterized protein n=1 Tax=Exophiala dermatitidis (strain ATCC 34100 / CBS 525.76 / NIH/UT8656) TaxID=858893 RepID=H6BNH3_EXODN|nr:uncharacterized protein HMPREF1120_00564 [Exophiala dermatitidis NIH/UT8656]EHY52350.1 hypothetical protein HMPREF1120_00564 [Exophiala dermatitidis NIH/UT8656]